MTVPLARLRSAPFIRKADHDRAGVSGIPAVLRYIGALQALRTAGNATGLPFNRRRQGSDKSIPGSCDHPAAVRSIQFPSRRERRNGLHWEETRRNPGCCRDGAVHSGG